MKTAYAKQNTIRIWMASNLMNNYNANLFKYLSIREQNKAKAFTRQEDRYRYIISRALIRRALSEASDEIVPPNRWRIRTLSCGKPWASDPAGTGNVYFNLSHAQGLSVVAVSVDQEVGIDIEPLNQDIQLIDLWAVLTERERFDLALTAPEKRSSKLLRIWTLKEAYLKLLGTGLGIDPATIQVGLAPLEIISDVDLQISSPLFLKNWIIEFNQEPYSLSLATWKSGSTKPAITFHLMDEESGKPQGPHHFMKRTSTPKKEARTWNDYTTCLSDAAATTRIGQQ